MAASLPTCSDAFIRFTYIGSNILGYFDKLSENRIPSETFDADSNKAFFKCCSFVLFATIFNASTSGIPLLKSSESWKKVSDKLSFFANISCNLAKNGCFSRISEMEETNIPSDKSSLVNTCLLTASRTPFTSLPVFDMPL